MKAFTVSSASSDHRQLDNIPQPFRIRRHHREVSVCIVAEKSKFRSPRFRAEASGCLRDNLLAADGFVEEHLGHSTVHRLLKEHESGVADHSRLLWAFLFLEIWFQQHARRWVSQRPS